MTVRSAGFDVGMKSLVASWLTAVMPSDDQVTCRTLMEKDLPFYLKNSFIALARKRVKIGAPTSAADALQFDLESSDIREAKEKLVNTLQLAILFNRADVELCISNALRIRHNLLLRPRQALIAFFFRKTPESPKKLLFRLIDSFGQDIPYLQKLQSSLLECEDEPLLLDRFEQVSALAQKSLYSGEREKILIKEIDLLLDFFNANGSLARTVVEDFFLTRGFRTGLLQLEGKEYWSREEIVEQLHKVILEESRIPRIIYSGESFFKIHHHRIERQPAGPYPSIFDYVKGKDSRRFTRKLFKNDKSAYAEFVLKVDRMSRWRDAKQIIDWELEKRHVDPYSKEAVRLGDVVFAKFFSKGIYT